MITLYGIKNCDSCRKARKWLDAEGVAHRFHDVRSDGLEPDIIAAWAAALGWETLINRRGATWRKLPDSDKALFSNNAIDAAAPAALAQANPTLFKRPLFDLGGDFTVGFGESEKQFIQSRLGRTSGAAPRQS